MKHTSGPWTLESSPYEDGTPYFIIKAGRGFYEDGTYGNGFTLREIMSKADAAVITAAPVILEALTELLEGCQRYDENPDSAVSSAVYELARDKASKALALIDDLRSSVAPDNR